MSHSPYSVLFPANSKSLQFREELKEGLVTPFVVFLLTHVLEAPQNPIPLSPPRSPTRGEESPVVVKNKTKTTATASLLPPTSPSRPSQLSQNHQNNLHNPGGSSVGGGPVQPHSDRDRMVFECLCAIFDTKHALAELISILANHPGSEGLDVLSLLLSHARGGARDAFLVLAKIANNYPHSLCVRWLARPALNSGSLYSVLVTGLTGPPNTVPHPFSLISIPSHSPIPPIYHLVLCCVVRRCWPC